MKMSQVTFAIVARSANDKAPLKARLCPSAAYTTDVNLYEFPIYQCPFCITHLGHVSATVIAFTHVCSCH